MLIVDRHQRPWIILTILLASLGIGAYVYFKWFSPVGLSAGSAAGLIFGTIALGLMLFATLLWANRWPKKGWFLMKRSVWLRGHIWLGGLSVLFVVLHAGVQGGGLLTQVLWVLTIATLVTGLFGLAMQQILPRLLSVEVEGEVPAIQIPHVCKEMRRSADIKLEDSCGWEVLDAAIHSATTEEDGAELPTNEKASVARFYAFDVRPFLQGMRRSPLADRGVSSAAFNQLRGMQLSADLGQALDHVEELCERRRQLGNQVRLHQLLHGWLIVHVPISLALMLLGIVHAIVSLYY